MVYKWSDRKQVTSNKELLDAEDKKQDNELATSIKLAFDSYKTCYYGHDIVILRTDSIKLIEANMFRTLSFRFMRIIYVPNQGGMSTMVLQRSI